MTTLLQLYFAFLFYCTIFKGGGFAQSANSLTLCVGTLCAPNNIAYTPLLHFFFFIFRLHVDNFFFALDIRIVFIFRFVSSFWMFRAICPFVFRFRNDKKICYWNFLVFIVWGKKLVISISMWKCTSHHSVEDWGSDRKNEPS